MKETEIRAADLHQVPLDLKVRSLLLKEVANTIVRSDSSNQIFDLQSY